MNCLQCGSDNPDNAAFCAICGKRFERGAGSPQFPMGGGQSPQGEYIPMMQDMPPESGSPQEGQRNPPMQDIAPTGYSMPQHYYPPAFPPYPSPEQETPFPPSHQEWGTSNPVSYPGQPPLSFTNEQAVQLPPTYPGAFSAPATPSPVAPEPWYKKLAKPLPVWAFLGIIVAAIALLVVLQLTGSDWAAGAMHVAIAAGIIAAVVAVATIVRTLLGMGAKTNPRRVVQYICAGLSILLLLTLCLAGFTQQSTIHGLQAHNLEGGQQWQGAINEYQLAGERAPASDNIARVYNEWGEQLAGQQRYQEAFVKFDVILNAFGSPAAEVNRAQIGEINAYLGWAKRAMDTKAYSDATQRYDELLQKPYCQASCQTQVDRFDATAYYDFAEFQLATQDYTDAVSNFATVLSRFPNTPEATKLHGDYAQSLYGEGQQQLASSCSTAIPTYQQLTAQFADTPQGQQAAAALKAPQPVKGRFVGVVPHAGYLSDVAALMKGLSPNVSDTAFYNILAVSPTTVINSDGTFTFKSISQGTYDLAWGTNNTADGSQSYDFYYYSDNSITYVAKVGPLCAFDFGDVHEDIPVAP